MTNTYLFVQAKSVVLRVVQYKMGLSWEVYTLVRSKHTVFETGVLLYNKVDVTLTSGNLIYIYISAFGCTSIINFETKQSSISKKSHKPSSSIERNHTVA